MIGFFSNSIAIILGAVNNLTDTISSIVVIIGAKIAGRKPDHTHPYGHGRVEYITAVVVSPCYSLCRNYGRSGGVQKDYQW